MYLNDRVDEQRESVLGELLTSINALSLTKRGQVLHAVSALRL